MYALQKKKNKCVTKAQSQTQTYRLERWEVDGGVNSLLWRSWRFFQEGCEGAARQRHISAFTSVATERSWCGRGKDLHTVLLGEGWWMRDRRDRSHTAWLNREQLDWVTGGAFWREAHTIAKCFVTAAWLIRFIDCCFSKIDALFVFTPDSGFGGSF